MLYNPRLRQTIQDELRDKLIVRSGIEYSEEETANSCYTYPKAGLRGNSDVEKIVANQNGRLGTATITINGRCGYMHEGTYTTEYAEIYSHVETYKLKL